MDHDIVLKKIPLSALFSHVGKRVHKMEAAYNQDEYAETKTRRAQGRELKRALGTQDAGPNATEYDMWEIKTIMDAKRNGDVIMLQIEWDYTKEQLLDYATKGQKIDQFGWEPIQNIAGNCDSAIQAFLEDFVSTKDKKCRVRNRIDHREVRRAWNAIKASRDAGGPPLKKLRMYDSGEHHALDELHEEFDHADEPSSNNNTPPTIPSKLAPDTLAASLALQLKRSEDEKAAVQAQLAELLARQAGKKAAGGASKDFGLLTILNKVRDVIASQLMEDFITHYAGEDVVRETMTQKPDKKDDGTELSKQERDSLPSFI
eukprot:jgi/Mesvir1/23407/Mv21099-RA.1